MLFKKHPVIMGDPMADGYLVQRINKHGYTKGERCQSLGYMPRDPIPITLFRHCYFIATLYLFLNDTLTIFCF